MESVWSDYFDFGAIGSIFLEKNWDIFGRIGPYWIEIGLIGSEYSFIGSVRARLL